MSKWSTGFVSVLIGLSFVAPGGEVALAETSEKIKLIRVPEDGVQPQAAVDRKGAVHLIYFRGEPRRGDISYVRSTDQGATFSSPIRVNSQPGSAVAAGTIRGAQLAVGEDARVHVAWNGSAVALPKGPLNPELPADNPNNGLPMLYSRLNKAGTAFEVQRNLMRRTYGLDGGGTVAADEYGNVYVAWHGSGPESPPGEGGRRVWVATSHDQGETFEIEEPAFDKPLGACGCCGMRIFANQEARVYALFRSATEQVNRDVYLLVSRDQGLSFEQPDCTSGTSTRVL
jgi:hypothetical protein